MRFLGFLCRQTSKPKIKKDILKAICTLACGFFYCCKNKFRKSLAILKIMSYVCIVTNKQAGLRLGVTIHQPRFFYLTSGIRFWRGWCF